MTGCQSELPLDFYPVRPLQVQFSGLDLSSDAGLLFVRQAEERLGI
ncbi:MAG: IS1380 family transposase, partial [Cyanobacteria bacterium P01_C01_bin.147]